MGFQPTALPLSYQNYGPALRFAFAKAASSRRRSELRLLFSKTEMDKSIAGPFCRPLFTMRGFAAFFFAALAAFFFAALDRKRESCLVVLNIPTFRP